jgi:hypothetical protein
MLTMPDFPIVVTLVYATSIVASIVMMMSLDTFSKEVHEPTQLSYYDNYDVLKMKVTKMAKDADVWAISAIVLQSASLIFYLTVNKMGTFKDNAHDKLSKMFNALIVFVMYGTHIPVVAMMLLIVCGMSPVNNVFKVHSTYQNSSTDSKPADLPSLEEDAEVLMQFGLALSLVVVGAAIAGTHLVNHAHVKDDFGGKKGVLQYIVYLLSLMLIAVGAIFHFTVNIHRGEHCDVSVGQFDTYTALRDMSAPLFVCAILEFIASIAWNVWRKVHDMEYEHPEVKKMCSKEWIMFYGGHFLGLLKYAFMFLVLYSYAMSATTYPCLIENEDAVEAGLIFGMGVLALYTCVITHALTTSLW